MTTSRAKNANYLAQKKSGSKRNNRSVIRGSDAVVSAMTEDKLLALENLYFRNNIPKI